MSMSNLINEFILNLRCKSFQNTKRGEICRIPGCSIAPSAPGTPTPIRLPQAPIDTFKQFLLYVYTGKVRFNGNFLAHCKQSKLFHIWTVIKLQILLQDNSVFEMLALAQELGVDELRNTCEDHVTSTLSVPSACTFLAAAMDIQDRTPGKIYTQKKSRISCS